MANGYGRQKKVLWGPFMLNTIAFAAHLGIMIYAIVELSDVTRTYPLSRPIVAVNPLTGYIVTTGIDVSFSTLKAVNIVIGFTATAAAMYGILGLAILLNTDWAHNTYDTGINGIRWLFTGVVLALLHLPVFYLMGVSDEYTQVSFFGAVFTSSLFSYASEMVGGGARNIAYGRVGSKRGGMLQQSIKIALSIGLAITAFIPVIFAYVNAYIVFESVNKSNMRDHLYVYAIVPFVVLVGIIFWTLLLGGRCIRPGMLYEFGHFLLLATAVITVGVLVTYHSDDF